MAGLVRGGVYWASLDPVVGSEQSGRRPVLVLSYEEFNNRSETVVAMAVTSRAQRAGYPFTVPIPKSIMPRESWIKTTQIRTLSVNRLGQIIAIVDQATIGRAIQGLLEVID